MWWKRIPQSNRNVAGLMIAIVLLVYFSPSLISERAAAAITRLDTDRYQTVTESRYEIEATITLQDSVEPKANDGDVHYLLEVNIWNKGPDTLPDFSWFGRMPEGLLPFTANLPLNMNINHPWVYGSYVHLLQQLLRTKYNLIPQGTPQPESRGRNFFTPEVSVTISSGVSAPAELGGLNGLLKQLQQPIRLKLMHRGGCDYVQVTPTIINRLTTPR